MGFYGNITNTSRTQFSFDKIYPNRKTMDSSLVDDGIYAGRYVLVEYDTPYSLNNFIQAYKKDNILYTAIPSTGKTLPIAAEGESITGTQAVKPGTTVYVLGEYNFDEVTTGMAFYKILNENIVRQDVPSYKLVNGKLEVEVNGEGEPVLQEKITYGKYKVLYQPDVGFSSDENSYAYNYAVDRDEYGISRGYDSTVWQKVYEGSVPRYVMVAELNSVVPTMDISSDAPTTVPMVPHFDVDSTNVYYKLHVQPSWGFRVKSAQAKLNTPVLHANGNITGQYTDASRDQKEYPSDETTQWKRYTYNNVTGESEASYYYADKENDYYVWAKDEQNIPGAIYFNKDGFNVKRPTYSYDKTYAGWGDAAQGSAGIVTDSIKLEPSGISGYQYNAHNSNYKTAVSPDTQELSIILPSIGDTIAKVWDVVYGDRAANARGREPDDTDITRDTRIEWDQASTRSKRDGLRLVNAVEDKYGAYTYEQNQVSTVAGAINSVHDLMGMIITDEMPSDDEWAGANENYIYYDKTTGKYYRKDEKYVFDESTKKTGGDADLSYIDANIIDFSSLSPLPLYVDSALKDYPDYISDPEFHLNRNYVPQNRIDNAMQKVEISKAYEPKTFYIPGTSRYASGLEYSYYRQDTGLEQSADKKYYELTNLKMVPDNVVIYVPNIYYYSDYVLDESITADNFAEAVASGKYYFIYRYSNGQYLYARLVEGDYDNPKGPLFGDDINDRFQGWLDGNPNAESGYDETASDSRMHSKGKLYKREYILDSGFTPTPNRVYFSLKDPEKNNNENAYYILIATIQRQVGAIFNSTNDKYVPGLYYARIPDVAQMGEVVVDTTTRNAYYQENNDALPSPQPFDVNKSYSSEYNFYVAGDPWTVINLTKDQYQSIAAGNQVGDYDKNNVYYRVKYYTIEKKYSLVSSSQGVIINDSDVIQIPSDSTLIALEDYENQLTTANGGKETHVYYLQENGIDGAKTYIKLSLNNYRYARANGVNAYIFYSFTVLPLGNTYSPYTYYYKENNEDKSYRVARFKEYNSDLIYYKLKDPNFDWRPKMDINSYVPNKYYARMSNGRYELMTGDYGIDNYGDPLPKITSSGAATNKIIYYNKDAYYVYSDTQGIYTQGAEWTPELPVPSTVTVAKRKIIQDKLELVGFARNLNTIHGLILRINQILAEHNTLSRDPYTITGIMNRIEDIFNKFALLQPQQPVIIDNYGRITSTPYTTLQAHSYRSIDGSMGGTSGTNQSKIALNIDGTLNHTKLTLTHVEPITVAGTSTKLNENDGTNNFASFKFYTPIVDNTGHIVGTNDCTVTLPYSFKTITLSNSTATTAVTGNTTSVIADKAKDTMTLAMGNKWLIVSGLNNTVTLGHALSTLTNGAHTLGAQTPDFGTTFNIPTFTTDEAGHITAAGSETVTLHALSLTSGTAPAAWNGSELVTNIGLTAATGAFTYSTSNVGTLKLIGYQEIDDSDPENPAVLTKIAALDDINGAFGKTQLYIDRLDKKIDNTAEDVLEVVGQDMDTLNNNIGQSITDINKRIDNLDYSETDIDSSKLMSAVIQEDGQITVVREGDVGLLTLDSYNTVLSTDIQEEIAALDVTEYLTEEEYQTAVSDIILSHTDIVQKTDTVNSGFEKLSRKINTLPNNNIVNNLIDTHTFEYIAADEENEIEEERVTIAQLIVKIKLLEDRIAILENSEPSGEEPSE